MTPIKYAKSKIADGKFADMAVQRRSAPMTFHLIRKNSMGYETAWCTDSDWHGLKHCKFPGERTLYRSPTIKTWKSRAGAERWMAERPGFTAEIASA